tara:strand:- start:5023 stop:5127 length:105 start_codon:yes stop_codon:yes gene_type:complete
MRCGILLKTIKRLNKEVGEDKTRDREGEIYDKPD